MHPSVKNQGEWKSWCQRRFPVSGWSWVILSSSWWARCTGWSKIYWQGPLWCCRAFGPASVLVKFKMWIRQLKLFWVHIRTPKLHPRKRPKRETKPTNWTLQFQFAFYQLGSLTQEMSSMLLFYEFVDFGAFGGFDGGDWRWGSGWDWTGDRSAGR